MPDPGASPLQVIVDGEAFDVAIAGSQTVHRARPIGRTPAAGSATVAIADPPSHSDCPTCRAGRRQRWITYHSSNAWHHSSVDVKVGQAVEPGQVVCVLEAMKMKNPIRATSTGTVAEIAVQPGQSVAYGDLLVNLG